MEFKIITLGNSGVGKISIILRYVDNIFNENQKITLGIIAFNCKSIKIHKRKISLKFIDIGESEK